MTDAVSPREIIRRCNVGLANLRAARSDPETTWGDIVRNGRKIALLEAQKWRALRGIDDEIEGSAK